MAEQLALASSPPSAAYLKHALEASRVTIICWLVLYLLDFFLTIGTERRHVWRSKSTPLKVFYFINRYVTLAALIGSAVFVLGRFSTESCSKICWVQPVLSTLAITLCAVLSALRVHTLYNRHRGILFLLSLPLLIMSGIIVGLSTQVRPFGVPPTLIDQVKFMGCRAIQSRKGTFLVIWTLPLCYDILVLLLTIVRGFYIRRKAGGTGVHVLARIVNKHILYFSIIVVCNALNVGFFVFADPSLKTINVPATVALASILISRLVLSLFSTNSTAPVACPTRRPSTSSSHRSRNKTRQPRTENTSSETEPLSSSGSSSSENEKEPAPRNEKGVNPSRTPITEEEARLRESFAWISFADTNKQDEPKNARPYSLKQPSIASSRISSASHSSKKGSSTFSSSSSHRPLSGQDHIIVPIVPDPSKYAYRGHHSSGSSSVSSSAVAGALRPLILATASAIVPPPAAASTIITVSPLPHPNPLMLPPPPPSTTSLAPPPPPTATNSSLAQIERDARLRIPEIEPSTPLTFSSAFFNESNPRLSSSNSQPIPSSSSATTNSNPLSMDRSISISGPSPPVMSSNEAIDLSDRLSFQSPLHLGGPNHESRRRKGGDESETSSLSSSSSNSNSVGGSSSCEIEYEEEGEGEEMGSMGDLGEMNRETRDKLKKEMSRLQRQLSSTTRQDLAGSGEGGGSPSGSGSGSSSVGTNSTGGGGSKRSSLGSFSASGSNNGGVAGDRRSLSGHSLRYFTSQFPNPNEFVRGETTTGVSGEGETGMGMGNFEVEEEEVEGEAV